MDVTLLNKISNLTFVGFYNPAGDLITVHFFNEASDKPDIMAYLQKDMSWDVREVLSEQSTLYPTHEEVVIKHRRVGVESTGSKLDEIIRAGLEKMARQVHGDDVNLPDVDKMFEILEKNSY